MTVGIEALARLGLGQILTKMVKPQPSNGEITSSFSLLVTRFRVMGDSSGRYSMETWRNKVAQRISASHKSRGIRPYSDESLQAGVEVGTSSGSFFGSRTSYASSQLFVFLECWSFGNEVEMEGKRSMGTQYTIQG